LGEPAVVAGLGPGHRCGIFDALRGGIPSHAAERSSEEIDRKIDATDEAEHAPGDIVVGHGHGHVDESLEISDGEIDAGEALGGNGSPTDSWPELVADGDPQGMEELVVVESSVSPGREQRREGPG